MNHGWGPSYEQRLSARDCDTAIGELVLRGDVARLFDPSGFGWPQPHLPYNATLELEDRGRVIVLVFKAAAGGEARLGHGWREICEDFNLMPGDVAVFTKADDYGAFLAWFTDADGNDKRRRLDAPDSPSSPDFRFVAPDSPSSPEFQVNADWVPAQGAEAGWGEQAAGAAAAGGGDRAALQGGDMTIKEAMVLAVQCGAREGSDEHYMATKLFVKAENRAMFLTFRTNAGRLQWL